MMQCLSGFIDSLVKILYRDPSLQTFLVFSLVSVSPYLKTLSMVASTKLLHLLEVCKTFTHFDASSGQNCGLF